MVAGAGFEPRPLGYEPYDARLLRLEQSLVIALTSAGVCYQVVSGLPRLPYLGLSRSVSCTNPWTNRVPELRVPALQCARPAGRTADRLLFRPDISQVGADRASVMGCRRSLRVAVGRCCCFHRCCHPCWAWPRPRLATSPSGRGPSARPSPSSDTIFCHTDRESTGSVEGLILWRT